MRKITLIILLIFLSSFCFAKTQKEEYQNDYLYSAEYFDYLIECAQEEREKELEDEKTKRAQMVIENDLADEQDIISGDFLPFHLKIEENIQTKPYKDSFKKVDSKTIIPISDKFSVIHDMSTAKNKYNATDYKILAGAEYQPFKFFVLSSGIETNYRGIDQNPASKKLYFSPGIIYKDKIALKFHNKMNVLNYSSDHDIGISISPFKSKILDFGVYSGVTRKKTGEVTESINFTTNFYF